MHLSSATLARAVGGGKLLRPSKLTRKPTNSKSSLSSPSSSGNKIQKTDSGGTKRSAGGSGIEDTSSAAISVMKRLELKTKKHTTEVPPATATPTEEAPKPTPTLSPKTQLGSSVVFPSKASPATAAQPDPVKTAPSTGPVKGKAGTKVTPKHMGAPNTSSSKPPKSTAAPTKPAAQDEKGAVTKPAPKHVESSTQPISDAASSIHSSPSSSEVSWLFAGLAKAPPPVTAAPAAPASSLFESSLSHNSPDGNRFNSIEQTISKLKKSRVVEGFSQSVLRAVEKSAAPTITPSSFSKKPGQSHHGEHRHLASTAPKQHETVVKTFKDVLPPAATEKQRQIDTATSETLSELSITSMLEEAIKTSKPATKAEKYVSHSLSWILDSLPHPVLHKNVRNIAPAELKSVYSNVDRRWALYGEIRELHSAQKFTELVAVVETTLASVQGDLGAIIADTTILDLVLDSYFSLQQYDAVIKFFHTIRESVRRSSEGPDPAHPKFAISTTSYRIMIESVLRARPSGDGIQEAISLYGECIAKFEPTPHLIMALFRGLDYMDNTSELLQTFALKQFVMVAQAHQFATTDFKLVLEIALNTEITKLGRTDLTVNDVFNACSTILNAAHGETYKRTLISVLPALVRKFNISSIDLLQLMRQNIQTFHPSSDLIDCVVEAELKRSGSDALHLYRSLETNLKHPRATQTSTYMRWVRNESMQTLVIKLAEQNHFREARAAIQYLTTMNQSVDIPAYKAVLATYLLHEDFASLSIIMTALTSSRIILDAETWRIMVLANLGLPRDKLSADLLGETPDRRAKASITLFEEMYQSLQRESAATVDATSPSSKLALDNATALESTMQHIVDWCVGHKSLTGLQRLVELAEKHGIVGAAVNAAKASLPQQN